MCRDKFNVTITVMLVILMISIWAGCQEAKADEGISRTFATEDNRVQVIIDANVNIKGELTSEQLVEAAKPHTITAEELRAWSELLFDGNEIFEYNASKTRDELTAIIEEDRNALDSLDPDYEPDLYEYRVALYSSRIAKCEELLETARDSYDPKAAEWNFKAETEYSDFIVSDLHDYSDVNDMIKVYSEIDGKTAYAECSECVRENFILNCYSFWIDNGYQQEKLQETEEEVKDYIMSILSAMGIAEKWTISSVKMVYQNDKDADGQTGYYYDITLEPEYGGLGILDQNLIFYTADLESYPYKYYYEELNIKYSNGRIVFLDYQAPLEITGSTLSQLSLADAEMAVEHFEDVFDSQTILEKYINAKYGILPESARIFVTGIEYGVVRVRTDPSKAEYQMIPVWNFTGKIICYYGVETAGPNWFDEEIMAISAIDGRVLSPEDGR